MFEELFSYMVKCAGCNNVGRLLVRTVYDYCAMR